MKIYHFTFVAIASFRCVFCSENRNYRQNDTRFGYIPGDYIIGALFPIHGKVSNGGMYNYECNNITTEYGIQVVEAAFFAIDLINRNETILPNITLGIDIKDYCRLVEVAEFQTKHFIDKSVSKCGDIKTSENTLIGIIGPEDYEISSKVGNVLNFFAIVQIFYSELLPPVNHYETAYTYLFSLTPNMKYMTDAFKEILTKNNWTYVTLIYDEVLFQSIDVPLFRNSFSNEGICISEEPLDSFFVYLADHLSKRGSSIKRIRRYLPSFDEVDAIVCYCAPEVTNSLFQLIKKYSAKKLVVISGDGWPPRQPRSREYSDVAEGEIVVSLKDVYIKEFDDYFLNLDWRTNQRNPWFADFWQDHFKCKINTSSESEHLNCTGDEKLIDGYKQNPKIPYVIESVFFLAYALHDMLEKGCGSVNGTESTMKNDFNRRCYRDYVTKVNLDMTGSTNRLKFDIHNLQLLKNGSYNYTRVGEYSINEMMIKMNEELVYSKNGSFFKSSCNAPCASNEEKIMREDKCCWDCRRCKPLEILNSTRCEECKNDSVPNSNQTSCIPISMIIIKWNDAQTLISLSFSSVIIILTTFAFYVFVKNQTTPVVKSSTKELCYMMFFGMISANLTPFTILVAQNIVNCWVVRILPPISFAFIYAALLVKTNRIARILAISKKKFPKLNAKFLSLKSQIVFAVLLIIAEALICSYSLFDNPIKIAEKSYEKNGRYHKIKFCSLTEGMMLETFGFIGGLILICTYYAVKTRNLPENFNEAKCIGLAMYATILTDISFVVIYFDTEFKVLTINLFISINTSIVFLFLFAPKLYVILWRPDKNTRHHFITTTSIRCFIANHPVSNLEPISLMNRNT